MASSVNLPRPPFIGTSWLVMYFVIIWISIDYADFHLPRGLKIRVLFDWFSVLSVGGRAGSRAAGLRPGGPGPPAIAGPSLSCRGRQVLPGAACCRYISIHLNVAYYTACSTVSGEVLRSCPTAYFYNVGVSIINSIPPRIAGIDTKKEASEIQKPRSGDRRSRTDDPLLAKQML